MILITKNLEVGVEILHQFVGREGSLNGHVLTQKNVPPSSKNLLPTKDLSQCSVFFFVGALLRTLQRMVTHTMALHFSGGSGAAADVHTLRMVLNVWRLVSPHGWTSDQSFTSSDKVAHLVGPW